VWLVGETNDVNAMDDTTVIVALAGTATGGGKTYPFQASVTIGSNRAIPVSDPSQPGLNPICKQRIVTPIPTDLALHQGGALFLTVDPSGFFTNVDFSLLDTCAADASVTGCAAGSSGFSCAGTDTPDQADADLTCVPQAAGLTGATLYCCARKPSMPAPYTIPDDNEDTLGRVLFLGILSSSGVYSFDYRNP
jgi:hypothetical protein